MVKTNMLSSTEAMLLVFLLSFGLFYLIYDGMVGGWIALGVVYVIFQAVMYFRYKMQEESIMKIIKFVIIDNNQKSISINAVVKELGYEYDFVLKTLEAYKLQGIVPADVDLIKEAHAAY